MGRKSAAPAAFRLLRKIPDPSGNCPAQNGPAPEDSVPIGQAPSRRDRIRNTSGLRNPNPCTCASRARGRSLAQLSVSMSVVVADDAGKWIQLQQGNKDMDTYQDDPPSHPLGELSTLERELGRPPGV